MKIGVQVTSTSKSQKINETLERVKKFKYYEQFNIIKVFLLSEKQKTYSIKCNSEKISFNWQRDIIDFDDLYKEIIYISIDTRLKISEFIGSEIVNVLNSIGVDYYDSYDFKRYVKDIDSKEWEKINSKEYKIVVNHCFGYLPFHIDVVKDGINIELVIERDMQKVILTSCSPLTCKVFIS